MSDYEIARTAGQCSVCGRALAEGESFYSVLSETADGFARRDIADECWQGPPADALCHFRTRIAPKAERRKTFVDDSVLIDFFNRLGDAEEPSKQRFRFVLALILLRKRLLKYEQTAREEGVEHWMMRGTKDKVLHRVLYPNLEESQIEGLTVELGAVLEGFAAEQDTDASTQAESPVEEATAPE